MVTHRILVPDILGSTPSDPTNAAIPANRLGNYTLNVEIRVRVPVAVLGVL